MRLELTRVGLLVQLANHYTTRGALTLKRCAWINEINNEILLLHIRKKQQEQDNSGRVQERESLSMFSEESP